MIVQAEESDRDLSIYERRIRALERANTELQTAVTASRSLPERRIGGPNRPQGEEKDSTDPCLALRSVEEASIESLSHMSEERLCKAIASAECISTKLRLALEEGRKRRQRELETERDRKESSGRSNEAVGTDTLCCVCYDKPKSMLLLPCRHLCLCSHCSLLDAVRTCPICRSRIQDRIEVFS